MAYVKILYQDSPSTATPLNAQNLNHMDDQIALNDQRLTDLEGAHVSSFNGRTGAVTPSKGDYDIGQIAPLTGAQVGQVPVVVNVGTEENPELEFQMGAGGGGGHVIQNASGTDMAQESAMQFPDSHVSDDSTNGRTVVENVKEVTLAELSQATERGMYLATDEESVPIGDIEEDSVSVTSSSDTYRSLINKLRDEIDFSKVTDYSYIKLDGKRFVCTNHDSGELQFTNVTTYSPASSMNTIFIFPTDNGRYYTDTMQNGSAPTVADNSTSSVTDGKTLTLYYGTSSTVINLKTSADYCQYDENTTVKQKIDKTKTETISVTFTSGKSGNILDGNKILLSAELLGSSILFGANVSSGQKIGYGLVALNSAIQVDTGVSGSKSVTVTYIES